MIDTPYEEQIAGKQRLVEEHIGRFCGVDPIIRMKNPDHYRNKVTAAFAPGRGGQVVCGTFRRGTRDVVSVNNCLIENTSASRIIRTIRELMPAFRLRPYSEDLGTGTLRYVQVRTARATGQVMVTLVTADALIPARGRFIGALRERHPEITTIVQNINDRADSLVLAEREKTLFGPGYIEDILCGRRFRISSTAFYQVNPIQTEKLYNIALDLAGFSGRERVLDAYCGIGTIGLVAAGRCAHVTGVELNPAAVADAQQNALLNGIDNAEFYAGDAGEFLRESAEQPGQDGRFDLVIMDPPRSGASEEFLSALKDAAPKKIVYVSCAPDSLERDLEFLTAAGYTAKKAVPVDMFPYTGHIETIVLLQKSNS